MKSRKRRRAVGGPNGHPAIHAIPLWASSSRRLVPLLTKHEQAALGAITSIVRFKKNQCIWREGASATYLLNIRDGVVKTCKAGADDAQHVCAFLFPGDLAGIAEEGRYVNTAVAITPVTAFKLPVKALTSLLKNDASIEFSIITKLAHGLRAAQRHAFLLSHRNAVNKVALFIQLIEEYETAKGAGRRPLYLPMSRIDIAGYVGLSPAALSRAIATLRRRGAITMRDKRHLTVADRGAFARALAGSME